MSFDIERLFLFCRDEISRFSREHNDETFYCFAIDAALICLNSEEQFRLSLANYRAEWESDTRVIQAWDELTDRDRSRSDFLLNLHAKIGRLDLSDKSACVNTINESRAKERAKGNPYESQDRIDDLRYNPGDWKYQGFATMTDQVGFDEKAYSQHYNLSATKQRTSEYGIAMDKLVSLLGERTVFEPLRRSADFRAIRVEHSY
jgi:hypothetical protein